MTAAGAAQPAAKRTPETSHDFNSFDPPQLPREPVHPLDIEQVFKHGKCLETLPGRDSRGRVDNQCTSDGRTGSEKYRLLPDGALQEDWQPTDSGLA